MDPHGVQRKLTAILSADVKGYSRLMGEHEVATIRTLTTYREVMASLIQQHRGRVVDMPGDNLLAEFASVVDAVQCAVEIQQALKARNAELPDHRRMEFRIGINLGDVVVDGERIYGDGVNIAARVEGLAEGGGICISGTAYDQVKNKLALGYESRGEDIVKNIAEPVRVYRVLTDPEAVGKTVAPPPRVARDERPVVCFIDDDANEIEIFQRAFGQDLQIVAATRLKLALAELKALGKKPNLFVLDLYFPVGRESTDEERGTMAQLKSEVDTAQRKLSSYLASIGQDRAGGLQLLEQVRREYRNVPVTFYTRKGTVEDVSACLDAGAVEVLRKPQPDEIDSQSDLYLQMEAATMAHRNSLVSRFEALSSSNSVLKKLAKIARFIWKNWGNF